MDSYLSANFPLSEFRDASSRPLTAADELRARWWAREILQPARNALGPIRVSSFIRHTDSGAHRAGDAVDVVALQVSQRALADWFAVNRLGGGYAPLRQVIHERNHVHLARILVPGATPGYLDEPTEGEYVATAPEPGRILTADYRAVLLALGAAAVVATR